MASTAAITLLRRAREGSVEAQLAAGKLYLEGGQGLCRSLETAFYWLRAAAAQGSREAQSLIGKSIPESSIKRPEAVVGYYEAAARTGSANADVTLSDWLLAGHIPGDRSRAYELLHRAASAHDRKAQLRLAVLLEKGEFGAAREAEALHWYEEAARGGSRAAAFALADWYWARQDPAAAAWMDRVDDAGDPEYAYRKAVLLMMKGNDPRAAALLEKAAEAGHAAAQLYFGLLHASPARKPAGIPHNLKTAAFWLEKASRAGLAHATFELYRLFRRREFSLRNSANAQRHLEMAAAQGHAEAQFLLGIACLRDSISPGADVTAARWFSKASRQGHVEAGGVIALLYRRSDTPFPAAGREPAELIRLAARSRIAVAARLELALAFKLSMPEMLLFDPRQADHGDCLAIDVRKVLPRTRRRILLVESESERALLDRTRRLLEPSFQHPTDVRGTYAQRKFDFEHTLTLLGAHAVHQPLRPRSTLGAPPNRA